MPSAGGRSEQKSGAMVREDVANNVVPEALRNGIDTADPVGAIKDRGKGSEQAEQIAGRDELDIDADPSAPLLGSGDRSPLPISPDRAFSAQDSGVTTGYEGYTRLPDEAGDAVAGRADGEQSGSVTSDTPHPQSSGERPDPATTGSAAHDPAASTAGGQGEARQPAVVPSNRHPVGAGELPGPGDRRQVMIEVITDAYQVRLANEEAFAFAVTGTRTRFEDVFTRTLDERTATAANEPEAHVDAAREQLWKNVQSDLKTDYFSHLNQYRSEGGAAQWQARVESALSEVPARVDRAVRDEAQVAAFREQFDASSVRPATTAGEGEQGARAADRALEREEAWQSVETGLRKAQRQAEAPEPGAGDRERVDPEQVGEQLLEKARIKVAAEEPGGFREHADTLFTETVEVLRASQSGALAQLERHPLVLDGVRKRFGSVPEAPTLETARTQALGDLKRWVDGEQDAAARERKLTDLQGARYDAAVQEYERAFQLTDGERAAVLTDEIALHAVASGAVERAYRDHLSGAGAGQDRTLPPEALEMVESLVVDRIRDARDRNWNERVLQAEGYGSFHDNVFHLQEDGARGAADRATVERRIERFEQEIRPTMDQIPTWVADQHLLRANMRGSAHDWNELTGGRDLFNRYYAVSDEVRGDLFLGYQRDIAAVDHHLLTDGEQSLKAILADERKVTGRPSGPGDEAAALASGLRGALLLDRYLGPAENDGSAPDPDAGRRSRESLRELFQALETARSAPSTTSHVRADGSGPADVARTAAQQQIAEPAVSRPTGQESPQREPETVGGTGSVRPPGHDSGEVLARIPGNRPMEKASTTAAAAAATTGVTAGAATAASAVLGSTADAGPQTPVRVPATTNRLTQERLLADPEPQLQADRQFLRAQWLAQGASEQVIGQALEELTSSARAQVAHMQTYVDQDKWLEFAARERARVGYVSRPFTVAAEVAPGLAASYERLVTHTAGLNLEKYQALESFGQRITGHVLGLLGRTDPAGLTQWQAMRTAEAARLVSTLATDAVQEAWTAAAAEPTIEAQLTAFVSGLGDGYDPLAARIDAEFTQAARIHPVDETVALYENGLIPYSRAAMAAQQVPVEGVRIVPAADGLRLEPDVPGLVGERVKDYPFNRAEAAGPRIVHVAEPLGGREVSAGQVAAFLQSLPAALRPRHGELDLPAALSWASSGLPETVGEPVDTAEAAEPLATRHSVPLEPMDSAPGDELFAPPASSGVEGQAVGGSTVPTPDPAEGLDWQEYTFPDVPEHVVVLGRHDPGGAVDLGGIPAEPGRRALVLALDGELLSVTAPVVNKIVEKLTAAAADGVRAWRIYGHRLADSVVRRLVAELDVDVVFTPGSIRTSTLGTTQDDWPSRSGQFGGWTRLRPYRLGVAGQAWLVDHLGPDFVAVPAVTSIPERVEDGGPVLSAVDSRSVTVGGKVWRLWQGDGWVTAAPQGVSLVPDLVPPVEDGALVLRVQGRGSDPVVQGIVRGVLERSEMKDLSRVRLVLEDVPKEFAAELARDLGIDVVFSSEALTFVGGSFLAVVQPVEETDVHRGWLRAYLVEEDEIFRPLREGAELVDEGVVVEGLGQMLFPSSWERELASRQQPWRIDHIAFPDTEILDDNGERTGTLLGESAVSHAVPTVSGVMVSDTASARVLAMRLPVHPGRPTISVAQVHDRRLAEEKLTTWRLLAPGLTRAVLHDDRRPVQVPASRPGSDLSARMRMEPAGTSWRPEYDEALDDPTRGTLKLVDFLGTWHKDRTALPLLPLEQARQVLRDTSPLSGQYRAVVTLIRVLERAYHRRAESGVPDGARMTSEQLRDAVTGKLDQLRDAGVSDPLSVLLADLADRPERTPDPAAVLEHLDGQDPLEHRVRITLEDVRAVLASRTGQETPVSVNHQGDEELRSTILAGLDALGTWDTRQTVLAALLRAAGLPKHDDRGYYGKPYPARVIDVGNVRLVEMRPHVHFVIDDGVSAAEADRTVQRERAAVPVMFQAMDGFTSDDGRTVFFRFRPLVTAGRFSWGGAQNIRLAPGSGRASAARVFVESSAQTLFHETSHQIGLPDRYAVDVEVEGPRPLNYPKRRLRPGNPPGPTHFRPNTQDLQPAVMSSSQGIWPYTLRDVRQLYRIVTDVPDTSPGGHPGSWLAGYDVPASHEALVGAVRRHLESLGWHDLLAAVDDTADGRIAGLPMNHPIVTAGDPRDVFHITSSLQRPTLLHAPSRQVAEGAWLHVQFSPDALLTGLPPVRVMISPRGESSPDTVFAGAVAESFSVNLVERQGTSASSARRQWLVGRRAEKASSSEEVSSQDGSSVGSSARSSDDESSREWGEYGSGQVIVLSRDHRSFDFDTDHVRREPGRTALVMSELDGFASGEEDGVTERIVERITAGAREGMKAWRVYADFIDEDVVRGLVGELGVDVVYSSGWIDLDSLNTMPDPESAGPFGGWSRVRPYRAAGPGQAWLVDDLGPEFVPVAVGTEPVGDPPPRLSEVSARSQELPGGSWDLREGNGWISAVPQGRLLSPDRIPVAVDVVGDSELVVQVQGDGNADAALYFVRSVLGSRSAQDGRPVRLLVGNVRAEVGAGLARDFGVELVFSADELVFHGSGPFVASVRPIGNTDVHRGWLRAYPVQVGAVVHPLPEGGVLLDGVVVQRVGEMHYPAALWEGVVESWRRPRQVRSVLTEDSEMVGV
ncbi:hypothetical protein KIH74_35540, partial [Kineosporia sp. J2-2]